MHWWNREPANIDDEPHPEGFDEWPVLNRIHWNMERMRVRISINQRQQKRLRWTIWGLIAGFVIVIGLLGLGVWQFVELKETQDDLAVAQGQLSLQQDAIEKVNKTFCTNGNESRKTLHAFFTYIVDVSAANPGNQKNPVIRKFFEDFQHTIDVAFAQRDCNDLTKKYEAPKFPEIPTPEEIRNHQQEEGSE